MQILITDLENARRPRFLLRLKAEISTRKNLMKSLWTGPRATAFLNEINGILARGDEHCALFIPERYQASFLSAFRRAVENTSNFMHEIHVGEEDNLLDSLQPVFCDDEWKEPSLEIAPSCHTRHSALPVLVCPNPDARAFGDCVNLAAILQANAKMARNNGLTLPWRMLFVLPPGASFPEEDTGFRHFHWWGHLRPSDLEFVMEDALAACNYRRPVRLWHYAMCRGLCATALEMVSVLIETAPTSLEQVCSVLRRHPLCTPKYGQMATALLEKGLPHQSRRFLPSPEWLEAWEEGILEIGCNDQPELHPAVLVAAGRSDILKKRILAGQIQVYFPLVQEVCHLLAMRFDQLNLVKEDNRDNLYSGEIGEFQKFFYNNPDYAASLPLEREAAYLWWKIRNNLAHQNLLEVKHAIKAVLDMENLRDSLNTGNGY